MKLYVTTIKNYANYWSPTKWQDNLLKITCTGRHSDITSKK